MVATVLCRPRYHRRVRKLIKVALVALGIRAFLRWRKNRQIAHTTSPAPDSDPADELRRKLAESREDDEAAEPEKPPVAVADRRAEVHEQGRATLDAMGSSNED